LKNDGFCLKKDIFDKKNLKILKVFFYDVNFDFFVIFWAKKVKKGKNIFAPIITIFKKSKKHFICIREFFFSGDGV